MIKFRESVLTIAISSILSSQLAFANDRENEASENVMVTAEPVNDSLGADFSYVGEYSRTATKTDLALSKTPQAVSVVTREQLDDRAVISIADALKYTPSIQANFYGEDNKQDWFIIRGFKQANNGLYQDGTRLYSSGFYSWQIDPFLLERVEIARGPTSTLNGQMPPGGIVNLVSKRAQSEEDTGEVGIKIGSYGTHELDLDINKVINEDLSVRLVSLMRENGTQVDGVDAQRVMIAPSLTWKINEDNKLTVLTSYQNDDSDPYLQFLPLTGTLEEADYGKISASTSLADLVGIDDWETFEREQTSLGYEFEHTLSDKLSFQQSARFSHMDIKLQQFYYLSDASAFGISADNSALIGASVNYGESDAFNVDNRLTYDVNIGNTKHIILVGSDYQYLDVEDATYDGNVLVSSTTSPLTGGAIFDLSESTSSFSDLSLYSINTFGQLTTDDLETTRTKNKQLGLYLQDQIMITDQLSLHAGLRYDDTETTIYNTSTGAETEINNHELTSSLGLSYELGNGYIPYARYAESFTPTISLDSNGDAAEPEYASLFEVGVKYQPTSFDGYIALATYHLTRENVAQGSGSSFTQVGEVRNIGAEFEAVVNLTKSLTLIGNFSVVDSEIKDDSDSSIIGNTPEQVSDNLASLWAKYRFSNTILEGLTIGAGLRHVGNSYAGNSNDYTVPSFTLLDSTISYHWNDYKFQLAAKNLLDKEYVATCYSDSTCFYGDRRNVTANVSYNW